ncbi:MAG: Fe-S cluster assembly protein SufD, partial [Candidatus Geothermarchaeales archaeon]
TEEAVEELSRSAGEPHWMLERRLHSLEAFHRLPMPHGKMEEWRYTDISGIDLTQFPPAASPGTDAAEPPTSRTDFFTGVEGCPALIQSDAQVLGCRISKDMEEEGVVFTDLGTALQEYPELVREHFMMHLVPHDRDKLMALHGAFWSGGTFVFVPRGVEVRLPLRSLVWSNGLSSGNYHHTLVVAESNSRVTLFEETGSSEGNEQSLHTEVAEVFIDEGAAVRFLALQDLATNSVCFSTRRASVGRDAEMVWLSGTFGSRLCKADVDNVFEGPGGEAENLGLFFGVGDQHLDISSNAIHIAPNTSSDMMTRGALKDTATSVYTGLIKIERSAKQTLSFLSENTLLLSDQARANAKPNLEIHTDDVRASHGATVGRLDQEQLFYLMSRGLPRQTAETLIVQGFFMPVLKKIEDKAIAQRYEQLITERASDGTVS